MKNKAFTLIELLAVIVILAIISLIAVPSVLNIIEDSRKGAAEASARNIVSAAKTYYMSETMNGRTPGSIDLSTNTLKYDGDQAEKGGIIFENGKASGKMYINGYCVEIKLDGTVTSEKKGEDECEIEISNPEVPTILKKYNNGEEVYFNPTTGLKCNAADAVSISETKSGCMKFYAFLDSEDSETVKLLLDHNTTNIGIEENLVSINEEVERDTAGWKQIVNGVEISLDARLINATEVHEISPATITGNYGSYNAFNVNDSQTYYYLHYGTSNSYTGAAGTNNYAWLFDNTEGCEYYGCNIEMAGTMGYWTGQEAEGYVWTISREGYLINTTHFYGHGNYIGIRPVIEVNKSVFK